MTVRMWCLSALLSLAAALPPLTGCASHAPAPVDSREASSAASTTSPPPIAGPSAPAVAGTPITVTTGVVHGPKQVHVALGSEVVLTVTADVSDEVHAHGYDATVRVVPGAPSTVRVPATIAGVFEVELEESGLQLTQLRVTP